MLGHNVEYANDLDDKTIMKMAKDENRILLTRDVELYKQATSRHVEVFLVEGRKEAERLALVSERFSLSLDFNPKVSRCPKCNARIRMAKKGDVSDRIPPSTKTFYEEFWECPKCRKIYWQGAHWKKILETLDKAKDLRDANEAAHSSRSHLSGTS
jgi:hypothetical protein